MERLSYTKTPICVCIPGSELLKALLVVRIMGIVVLVRPGRGSEGLDRSPRAQDTAWPPDDRDRTSCDARAGGDAENAGGGHWECRRVERMVC